jgi:peptidoglycan/xylan/chitin deacetylase (PgdA/CDA1 family)
MNPSSQLPGVPPVGARIRYSSVTTDQPVLAMTFDDGPHPSLTPKLLDILAQRNIKCTFFVIGDLAARYPSIMKRIVAEGHEVANHTYTHRTLTASSDAKIREELQKSQDAIMRITGTRPRMYRPPGGATNQRINQMIHNEFGYSCIMWSVDPQDWRRPGVSVVTSRLVNGAHNGAIMLAHDIHPPTITAMPAMFDQLLAKRHENLLPAE